MPSIIIVILIAISLSMDAFSLSLIYGMLGMTQKQKVMLSIVVGLFHLIMPIIGVFLGNIITKTVFININIVTSLILIYIGISFIVSNNQKKETLTTSIYGFILFGLSVSFDSLTLGLGLKAITTNYIQSSIIFSITSLIFTYIGLVLGSFIVKKIGIYAKQIGGIVLIIIAIITFIEHIY